MQDLLKNIQVRVNDRIYAKDPDSSELGKNIIRESVVLIHEIGFEAFTFKKLATNLNTTESTIYRYFENKHRLLVYLTNWYWGWLEYEIVLGTSNIADPAEILEKIINIVSKPPSAYPTHELLELEKLYEIIIAESPKAFLTKFVEDEAKDGFFASYLRVNERICKVILDIAPSYQNARSLASVLMDAAGNQRFLSIHFPALTEIGKEGNELTTFLCSLVMNNLRR